MAVVIVINTSETSNQKRQGFSGTKYHSWRSQIEIKRISVVLCRFAVVGVRRSGSQSQPAGWLVGTEINQPPAESQTLAVVITMKIRLPRKLIFFLFSWKELCLLMTGISGQTMRSTTSCFETGMKKYAMFYNHCGAHAPYHCLTKMLNTGTHL